MPTLRSIVGHARQCELLLQDIEQDNISHAYLFSGEKSLGKFTIARWFASQILTQNLEEQAKKDATHLIEKNIHPDLLTLDQLWIDGECTDWNIISLSSNLPQDHRAKSKVKTNVIGIDDIRALQERLHETSQTGKTCCIIRSIGRLHMTAANALLKILEEPPKHVVFCLTAENLSSLPQTVVSRLRVIRFSPLSNDELLPMLEDFSEEDRRFILAIAQGHPGMAFRCKEDFSLLRSLRQENIDAKNFLETSSAIEKLKKATDVIEKDNSPFFLHLFLHLQSKLHSEDKDEVEKALNTLKELFPLLHILQSNTNKKLLAAKIALQC